MDWNEFKDLLKTSGKSAVNGAFAGSPLADIINNAPDLFNEAATSDTGQAVARGMTGSPITDNVSNAGNPVDNITHGLLAPSDDAATPSAALPKATPAPDMAAPISTPETPESDETSTSQSSSTPSDSAKADDDLLSQVTPSNNDNEARKANDDALERRKKLNIIPQLGADASDAIAGAASAFGGNVPGGAGAREIERQDKDEKHNKEDFELHLKNDPNSDISKQYQGLLAKFVKKDASDPSITGRSAAQISEQIPAIEKLAAMQNQKDMKDLQYKTLQTNKDIALGMRNDAKQGEYEKQGRDILLKQLSNRSGGLGLQDAKVNQAIDLQQMMNQYYDPKTDTYNIPPSMHTELAIGLQRLLSPNGQTAQALVNELQQKTAREGLAGGLIYLGMDPKTVGGTTQGVSHLFAEAVKRQGLNAEHIRGTYQDQLKHMLPTQLNDKVKQELIKQNLGSNYSDFIPGGSMYKSSIGSRSSASSAPATKQINGQNYIQKDGKWYKA